MEIILNKIRELSQYQQLLKQLHPDSRQLPGLALPRAARLPLLAALHLDVGRPILLITDRADHSLALFDELGFWVRSPRYHFAEPNPLFYEQAAWGVTTRRERLHTLTALSSYHLPFVQKPEIPPIFVTSARSLMTRTMPRRDFLKACKKLTAGQSTQPDVLLRSWVEIGYQRVNTVLEPGQFSRRGGIMDVWAPAEKLPVRLDFFGDEVETMRRFDPATQRTVEKLESILITPAREYIQSDKSDMSDQSDQLTEFHIPLLHQQSASLLDYLPQKALVLVDDLSVVESMVAEIEEQAVKLRQDSITEGTLAPDFPLPYVTWPELLDNLQDRSFVELGHSTSTESEETEDSLSSCFSHDERFGGRLKPFVEYLTSVVERGEQAIIVSRQASRLQELWLEADQRESESENPQFIEASVSEGFVLQNKSLVSIHLISDSEVFGWERPQPRTRQRPVAETPESVYADLQVGDYVVHIDHGVGRFGGLVQRELDNHLREFLAVEYEGGGQLYACPSGRPADALCGCGRRGACVGSFGRTGVARQEGPRQAGSARGRAGDAGPVCAAQRCAWICVQAGYHLAKGTGRFVPLRGDR
jgi:transcription-repair coupling factor (superfamily II helicase)